MLCSIPNPRYSPDFTSTTPTMTSRTAMIKLPQIRMKKILIQREYQPYL